MKRLFAILLMTCSLSAITHAQILSSATPEADSLAFAKVRARMDSIRQYRPTVGLVLAGGGARGLAHLGVIKYMEELGIPVDVITGTSMGGLVGGLYALGYTHDQLDSLVRDIQWPVMMSDNIPNAYLSHKLKKYRERFIIRIPFHYDDEDLAKRLEKERVVDVLSEEAGHKSTEMLEEAINKIGIGMPDGYLYGLNVRNMLSSVSVGYQDSLSFSGLPIPFACVATDLYSMTPKYWTSGNLNDAMRSTMAIPFYFRAVRENGEILLDGGMRNNFPVDLAKEMGADIVIGSEMSVPRQLDELNNPMDFIFQTITLLSKETAGPARKMLDLDVHHELAGYNMLSFDDKSVDDIIDQGYQNALSRKEMFESIAAVFADKVKAPVSRPAPAVNLSQKKVRVSEVRYTGIPEEEQEYILRKDDLPSDSMYDRTVIEGLLNKIYGTNVFESVTYHLEGKQEPFVLVFDCQKGQVNDFALGIRADTDETVAVALHLGLGTRRFYGHRVAADLKLGTNPALTLDLAYKPKTGPTVGIVHKTRFMNALNGWMNNTDYRLLSTAMDGYIEDSRLRFGSMRMGITAEMTPYEHYLTVDDMRTGWDWNSYWLSGFASLKLDTFDDGYFPTKGIRFVLDGRYVFKGNSRLLDYDPIDYYYEEYDEGGETGGGQSDEDGYLYDGNTGTSPVMPDDWKKGKPINPYCSIISSFQAAISIGERFTVLPILYFGWDSTDRDSMHPMHCINVGGFMPGRYTEHQVPFFGFSYGFRDISNFVTMDQLDLRYRFARKNYITARAGAFWRNDTLKDLFGVSPVYAFGGEFSRQTMVGPLRLAVQWCDITKLSVYASIGFDF